MTKLKDNIKLSNNTMVEMEDSLKATLEIVEVLCETNYKSIFSKFANLAKDILSSNIKGVISGVISLSKEIYVSYKGN